MWYTNWKIIITEFFACCNKDCFTYLIKTFFHFVRTLQTKFQSGMLPAGIGLIIHSLPKLLQQPVEKAGLAAAACREEVECIIENIPRCHGISPVP